ncbi:MAG: LysM peptidoglycan-binding domain-containing protein [Candidatus Gracilibacteria bacterium]|nr:LysM peptidoglycan-binding domain-containing protein [Candidatus Gracilibacteria bacterium]
MKLKINIQARLKRHARNSSSFNKKRVFSFLKKFKFFSFLIVIILPVYPSFGAFGLNEETAVGNYDETTIITAYEGDNEDSSIFSKESGFIKSNGTLDDTRDVSDSSRLLVYTVQHGDSLGSIAAKFNVSINSIMWANNFGADKVLHPNDTISIPPVTGLTYTVIAGDTIQDLAKKYKVDATKIASQNKLSLQQGLLIGQQIIIPGGVKINPPKPANLVKKDDPKKKLFVKTPSKKVSGKTYATGYTGKGSKFAWGNCTYFVANHKNVTWHGNANAWLRNAAAAGVPTGSAPAPGAIISFQGSGYNPYYGHVGLVVDVDGDDVVIKDMNYRRLNEVTIRRVSKNDPAIRGYIYTD